MQFTNCEMWNKTRIIPNVTFRILPPVFMYILSFTCSLQFADSCSSGKSQLRHDFSWEAKACFINPNGSQVDAILLLPWEDIWLCMVSQPGRRVLLASSGVEARNAAKHLPMHQTTPTKRSTCLAQISVGLSLKNPNWTHHSTSHTVLYLLALAPGQQEHALISNSCSCEPGTH